MNEGWNRAGGCGCHECQMETLAQHIRDVEHRLTAIENYRQRLAAMDYYSPALIGAVSIAGAGRGGEVSLSPLEHSVETASLKLPEKGPTQMQLPANRDASWYYGAFVCSVFLVALFAAFLLVGCTENEMARSLGGTMYVDLPCNEKLFDITWKERSFWYATRPMRKDETAETYTFREDSSYGVYEGKVIVKECEK